MDVWQRAVAALALWCAATCPAAEPAVLEPTWQNLGTSVGGSDHAAEPRTVYEWTSTTAVRPDGSGVRYRWRIPEDFAADPYKELVVVLGPTVDERDRAFNWAMRTIFETAFFTDRVVVAVEPLSQSQDASLPQLGYAYNSALDASILRDLVITELARVFSSGVIVIVAHGGEGTPDNPLRLAHDGAIVGGGAFLTSVFNIYPQLADGFVLSDTAAWAAGRDTNQTRLVIPGAPIAIVHSSASSEPMLRAVRARDTYVSMGHPLCQLRLIADDASRPAALAQAVDWCVALFTSDSDRSLALADRLAASESPWPAAAHAAAQRTILAHASELPDRWFPFRSTPTADAAEHAEGIRAQQAALAKRLVPVMRQALPDITAAIACDPNQLGLFFTGRELSRGIEPIDSLAASFGYDKALADQQRIAAAALGLRIDNETDTAMLASLLDPGLAQLDPDASPADRRDAALQYLGTLAECPLVPPVDVSALFPSPHDPAMRELTALHSHLLRAHACADLSAALHASSGDESTPLDDADTPQAETTPPNVSQHQPAAPSAAKTQGWFLPTAITVGVCCVALIILYVIRPPFTPPTT